MTAIGRTGLAILCACQLGGCGTDRRAPFDAAAVDAAAVDTGLDAAADATVDSSAAPARESLCTIGICPAGRWMCAGRCIEAGDLRHGCAVGVCAAACNVPHAKPICRAGACAIESCEPGWGDCNGMVSDGCEADLSSPETCNSCSVACSGALPLCSASGCVSACTPPLTLCTDRCLDLSTSTDNCGECGTTFCGIGICRYFVDPVAGFAICSGGACAASCFPGYTRCGTACVDTTKDEKNCGACGNACPTPTDRPANALTQCTNSHCVPTCQVGWTACGQVCTTLPSDPANCGACGRVCDAGEVCSVGLCTPAASLTIATGVTVAALVEDPSRLYWTDGIATVSSVAKTGGPVVLLAQAQAAPAGLALDDKHVYWTSHDGKAILRTRKDGAGTPELVAAAPASPTDIAVLAGNVYWIDDSGGNTVWTSPKTGGGATVAHTEAAGADRMIANENDLFVLGNRAAPIVYSVFAGWSFAPDNLHSNALVTDGTRLYYAPVGTGGCSISWEDVSPFGGSGAFDLFGCQAGLDPVAANSCGVFFSSTLSVYPDFPPGFRMARPGTAFAPLVIPMPIRTAAADDHDLYFYDDVHHTIGKLPLR